MYVNYVLDYSRNSWNSQMIRSISKCWVLGNCWMEGHINEIYGTSGGANLTNT